MANILVTGNAGFIGMHTMMQLINLGHNVVGLDNLNQYYDINLKYGRLAQLGISKDSIRHGTKIEANENVGFIHLNLEDTEGINDLFGTEKFDYVIHLAAQAGVRYSLENPHAYVDSNIKGFLNILEACRTNDVKHLIYASSSSVYGLNKTIPFEESNPTEHPVSLYAATKKANEMMAHSYANLFKIPVTGLRFFTVYGPWGRPDMALFKFTKNILEGKPIDVYNYGNMQRDFTYVDDIVNGIIKTIHEIPGETSPQETDLSTDESPAPYRIYNIGNSKPVKLTDFVEALEEVLGIKANVNLMPIQPGDVTTTYANVGALKTAVDYNPTTDIKEGIKHFVDWYKSFYNI